MRFACRSKDYLNRGINASAWIYRNGRAGSDRREKMAPFLGPLLKEAKWKVKSGMAKRRADPAAGKATREMSRKTESEGHLSAASFGTYSSALAQPKPPSSAAICRNFGKSLQYIYLGRMGVTRKREPRAGVIKVGMQNPAHSLHSLTLGRRTSDLRLGPQPNLKAQGLTSEVRRRT